MAKAYEAEVGELVYSKYNTQFQADRCKSDAQREQVADKIEAILATLS